MASDFIINVNEADFEYQVLEYSKSLPVVVDFWAEWCGPCRVLGPMLEQLAVEAQGTFRLAKLNVDENPNLALRYAVRSIPVVKAFRGGQMIAEFMGAQPEQRLREFLRSIAPTQGDLAIEKGYSLLAMQRAQNAEQAFREALNLASGNSSALLGLARSLLMEGQGQESYAILANFPASREYASAEILLPLAQGLINQEKGQIFTAEDPLDPAFFNAMRLVKRGNFEAAMDGLLDVLRENKRYRDGMARRILVGILEMLGNDNPLTRQYRSELASVLF